MRWVVSYMSGVQIANSPRYNDLSVAAQYKSIYRYGGAGNFLKGNEIFHRRLGAILHMRPCYRHVSNHDLSPFKSKPCKILGATTFGGTKTGHLRTHKCIFWTQFAAESQNFVWKLGFIFKNNLNTCRALTHRTLQLPS